MTTFPLSLSLPLPTVCIMYICTLTAGVDVVGDDGCGEGGGDGIIGG